MTGSQYDQEPLMGGTVSLYVCISRASKVLSNVTAASPVWLFKLYLN